VRQNLCYFLERPYKYYLVLSGDHLYRMDYGDLLHEHVRTGADVTLGTPRSTGRRLRAVGFCRAMLNDTFFALKKPKDPKLLDELRIPANLLKELGIDRSVIGIRSVIESGTTIHNSVLMGASFYQAETWEPKPGAPPLGIGRHTSARRFARFWKGNSSV
jgi:ADP-glucose pyrophosphorylase